MKIYKHKDYSKIIQDFCTNKITTNKVTRKGKDFTSHYEYIISTIYILPNTNKSINKGDFISINAHLGMSLISFQEFKTIMQDLCDLNILESDNQYIAGEKSKGYRLLEYKTDWYYEEIDDINLSKKLDKLKQIRLEEDLKKGGDGYEVIKRWSYELEINEQKANLFLDNKIIKECTEFINTISYNDLYYDEIMYLYKENTTKCGGLNDPKQIINIEFINVLNTFLNVNKLFNKTTNIIIKCLDFYTSQKRSVFMMNHDKFFYVDDFGKRCHNNITNISRHLRPFLSINNEELYQVDIANSQPTFLGLLMLNRKNIDKAELNIFLKECKEGNFYEYLAQKGGYVGDVKNDKDKRKEFKQKVFTAILFGKNRPTFSEWELIFKKAFPSIFNEIREIKCIDYKSLSNMLQAHEAKLIFDAIPKINGYFDGEVPLLTIHDSIVSNNTGIKKVKEYMEKEFNLKYKFIPKLEITKL